MADEEEEETSPEIPTIWKYIKCNGHFMIGVRAQVRAKQIKILCDFRVNK